MDKKVLNKLIENEARRVNNDFHAAFRTRWNIEQMVKRGLRRLAREISNG